MQTVPGGVREGPVCGLAAKTSRYQHLSDCTLSAYRPQIRRTHNQEATLTQPTLPASTNYAESCLPVLSKPTLLSPVYAQRAGTALLYSTSSPAFKESLKNRTIDHRRTRRRYGSATPLRPALPIRPSLCTSSSGQTNLFNLDTTSSGLKPQAHWCRSQRSISVTYSGRSWPTRFARIGPPTRRSR